jgi:hypothetical protein
VVIVENQLETSDHTHLGQLLTYAAGTDPMTIVWIAAAFRPEHRAALDWLNARTDEDTRFFGAHSASCASTALSRPQRSSSLPSRMIGKRQFGPRRLNPGPGRRSENCTGCSGQGGWSEFVRTGLRGRVPLGRPRTRGSLRQQGCPVRRSTAWTRRGLSSELVFESPDPSINTARLEALRAQRTQLEAAYGGALDLAGVARPKGHSHSRVSV